MSLARVCFVVLILTLPARCAYSNTGRRRTGWGWGWGGGGIEFWRGYSFVHVFILICDMVHTLFLILSLFNIPGWDVRFQVFSSFDFLWSEDFGG